MKILFYNDDQHVGGEPEDEEARVVMTILKNFFRRIRGCPLVWLLFDVKTGCGQAVATGPFVLKPGARKRLWDLDVGCEPVPTQFHQTLLDFGLGGLRWNGHALVANGD